MKAISSGIRIIENEINIQKMLDSRGISDLLDFVSKDYSPELPPDRHSSYILECLAPILFSQKPAELLNIGLPDIVWNEFRLRLRQIPNIELLEIREICQRRQIFFFNSNVLERILINPISQEFLQFMNYPRFSTVDEYLIYLIEKICFHDFPHEIGLFLGYPLKDVLGFMGLVSLPYIKTQGWRVYGDERISDSFYEQYIFARQLMNKAIEKRNLD